MMTTSKSCFRLLRRKNLPYNERKCTFSTRSLNILGSVVSEGETRLDPDRLKPLQQLAAPSDTKVLKRITGTFSYYSQWIKNFYEKIKPLVQAKKFPLEKESLTASELLKADIENSVVCSIDESLPFEIETDASDVSLATTFFSTTLNGSELKSPAIEKEAAAIIKAMRRWEHYLTGKHFTFTTDQKSVAFVFNKTHGSEIKNDEIMRWRIELSNYDFDIKYRCGKRNVAADALSTINCFKLNVEDLHELHNTLCHPGVTRMTRYVKVRNVPFSVDDI